MNFAAQRERMVSTQLRARGIKDKRVLDVMSRVPRHYFVPQDSLSSAYSDFPLSIGEGQTISQPFMVADMTKDLQLCGNERVLEIGTGSGYQTAILAELADEVTSIERHATLAQRALKILAELGYTNIRVHIGDGTLGFTERAPYQGILVTAGAPSVPPLLLEQLTVGGRLVVPVGGVFSQIVEIHTRVDEHKYSVVKSTACRFVQLIGEHGWKD